MTPVMPHRDALEPPPQPNVFKFVGLLGKDMACISLACELSSERGGRVGRRSGTKDETMEERRVETVCGYEEAGSCKREKAVHWHRHARSYFCVNACAIRYDCDLL